MHAAVRCRTPASSSKIAFISGCSAIALTIARIRKGSRVSLGWSARLCLVERGAQVFERGDVDLLDIGDVGNARVRERHFFGDFAAHADDLDVLDPRVGRKPRRRAGLRAARQERLEIAARRCGRRARTRRPAADLRRPRELAGARRARRAASRPPRARRRQGGRGSAAAAAGGPAGGRRSAAARLGGGACGRGGAGFWRRRRGAAWPPSPATSAGSARRPRPRRSRRPRRPARRFRHRRGEGISTVALSVITAASDVVLAHEVADLDAPFDEFGFGDALADIGQLDHELAHRHASSISTQRAADARGPGEIVPFLRMRIGRVPAGDPLDRRLQMIEAVLLHQRGSSAPKPEVSVASCTITQRPVFFTEARSRRCRAAAACAGR